MIDRTRLLLPLRRRTLVSVTGVSAAAWIACPLMALLVLLAACLTYAVIEVVFIVVLVVGCVALAGGLLAAVAGLFMANEQPGVLFGGALVAAIGFGLFQLAQGLNVGNEVFLAMIVPAKDLLNWFVLHDWCIWAWGPAALAGSIAVVTWAMILIARCGPDMLRRVRRRFHDCPTCHHRGRPVYICPQCGSAETDLRASGYGLLFGRCSKCGKSLPTLDLLGRSRLQRRCGKCASIWTHSELGRLPVWHVAVIYADRITAPRTELLKVSGKLVFVHESAIKDVADIGHASNAAYLNLVDQVLVIGDEPSLVQSRRLAAGTLGVLERAISVAVRRRHGLSVVLVERRVGRMRALTPKKESAATSYWRSALGASFKSVTTWAGTPDRGFLATLI